MTIRPKFSSTIEHYNHPSIRFMMGGHNNGHYLRFYIETTIWKWDTNISLDFEKGKQ